MDGLNLPVGEAETRYRPYTVGRRPPPRLTLWRRLRRWMPAFLLVILPTIAASVYYFAFAAEQFVSEARFVVRGPSSSSTGVLSSLMQGAGITRSQDDTFSVQDYIVSRDGLADLSKHADVRQLFARPESDLLSRFPLLPGWDTFEHLYKYYLRHVDVEFDSTTGVTTLTVRAFRADDAKRIATVLLGAGEDLINRMNDRQRENAVRLARREVDEMEGRVRDVAAQIATFRNRETILDPTKQSVPILQGIADLQTKLTQTKIQIAELSKSSPNSPLIASAQRRAVVLQAQIDDQRSKVAGSDTSLVPKITEFDKLSLDREFADKELASAVNSMETARLDAERQQLYLDLIVQPNQADYPAYPKRFASIAIVFVSCFGIYTIARLLLAGAREHRHV